MKYILYIVLVLTFFTSVYLVTARFQKKEPPPDEIVLSVNEWKATRSQLQRMMRTDNIQHPMASEFINSLIIKKLLIQEAKRQGIDREEAFKDSVREFYEQALIKILLDRKIKSLNVDITDAELQAYTEALGTILQIRTGVFDTESEALNASLDRLSIKEIPFKDLSEEVQLRLLPLKKGKKVGPFPAGKGFSIIIVENIKSAGTDLPEGVLTQEKKQQLRNRLRKIKQQILLQEWIQGLRSEASIKVNLEASDE